MTGPLLGHAGDFPDGCATPSAYQAGGREAALLVVRRGDDLRAYLNVCPHQYLPLTYRSERVLSTDGDRLRCSNHGAEFAVSDGRPVSGPCGGRGLISVNLLVAADGNVHVDVPKAHSAQ
ncbi:MAG: Rieske (2Fe-2S) protein [Xanthobacteraceae bacterium]